MFETYWWLWQWFWPYMWQCVEFSIWYLVPKSTEPLWKATCDVFTQFRSSHSLYLFYSSYLWDIFQTSTIQYLLQFVFYWLHVSCLSWLDHCFGHCTYYIMFLKVAWSSLPAFWLSFHSLLRDLTEPVNSESSVNGILRELEEFCRMFKNLSNEVFSNCTEKILTLSELLKSHIKDGDAENSLSSFLTFSDSFLKTTVISTGEFDASVINFSTAVMIVFISFLVPHINRFYELDKRPCC